MTTDQFHRGQCADCGKPMVSQRAWFRDPAIRVGRVKLGGWGRCNTCYQRARRSGGLPPMVEVIATYSICCVKCGPVAEASSSAQATRLRGEHLAQMHGVPDAGGQQQRLSEAELARLRQAVGLAS